MSLSLMHETLAFLNLKMPSGRKVSGRWIGILTSVPLTTDFAVPRLVHAVFKCQASCSNMHCDDFVSRYVSETEVKLMYGKNKAMALHAEQILGRLKKVMDESNRSSTLDYGELSIKIAEVVLGKEKDGSITDCPRQPFPVCMCVSNNGVRAVCAFKFRTRHRKSPHEFRSFHFTFPNQDIAKAGVADIFGQSGASPDGSAATCATLMTPPAQQFMASGDMVAFDGDGTALDLGKRSVHAAGFLEGAFVQFNAKTCAALKEGSAGGTGQTYQHQWQITKINNDGSALLSEVSKDGNLQADNVSSVSMDRILSEYKVAAAQIEVDQRTPLIDAGWQTMLEVELCQAIVYSALYKKRNDIPADGVGWVQLKPSKAVFSLRTVHKGDHVAMPMTSMKHLKTMEDADADTTFMINLQHANGQHVTKFSMSQEGLKTHLSLAFQFKRIEKQEDANLQVSLISQKVHSWALGKDFIVQLPVVVATAVIDVDQEMVMYVPATTTKVETKRKAKDISFGDTVKTVKKVENTNNKDKKDKKDKSKKAKTA